MTDRRQMGAVAFRTAEPLSQGRHRGTSELVRPPVEHEPTVRTLFEPEQNVCDRNLVDVRRRVIQ